MEGLPAAMWGNYHSRGETKGWERGAEEGDAIAGADAARQVPRSNLRGLLHNYIGKRVCETT